MRFFRAFLLQRTFACLLIAVFGTGLMSPQVRAENDSTGYTAWITLHVPGSIPASVELALAEAENAQPRSLDGFLDLFFSEIEKNGSEKEFMDWLYGESADHTVLRQDLRFRLLNIISTGIFWRSMDIVTAAVTQSSARSSRASTDDRVERVHRHLPSAQLAILQAMYSADARYIISVAQPQGP